MLVVEQTQLVFSLEKWAHHEATSVEVKTVRVCGAFIVCAVYDVDSWIAWAFTDYDSITWVRGTDSSYVSISCLIIRSLIAISVLFTRHARRGAGDS